MIEDRPILNDCVNVTKKNTDFEMVTVDLKLYMQIELDQICVCFENV